MNTVPLENSMLHDDYTDLGLKNIAAFILYIFGLRVRGKNLV